MTVVVIARFTVSDLDVAKKSINENVALIDEITADSKQLGAIHHRFVEGASELVVIDEWDSAESFQKFFDGNTKIAKVMEGSGLQGPPVIEFFESVEAAGTF